MITEDYVSFEVAKLLKEKRFVEKTFTYFDNELLCHGEWFEWNNSPMGQISAPTLQMAMKWLREIHNLHIGIVRSSKGYHITIETLPHGVVQFITREIVRTAYVDSYEEACEAAIKYCLENLIK